VNYSPPPYPSPVNGEGIKRVSPVKGEGTVLEFLNRDLGFINLLMQLICQIRKGLKISILYSAVQTFCAIFAFACAIIAY